MEVLELFYYRSLGTLLTSPRKRESLRMFKVRRQAVKFFLLKELRGDQSFFRQVELPPLERIDQQQSPAWHTLSLLSRVKSNR